MTGVQTCALPISKTKAKKAKLGRPRRIWVVRASRASRAAMRVTVRRRRSWVDRKSVVHDWSSDVCSSDLEDESEEGEAGKAASNMGGPGVTGVTGGYAGDGAPTTIVGGTDGITVQTGGQGEALLATGRA